MKNRQNKRPFQSIISLSQINFNSNTFPLVLHTPHSMDKPLSNHNVLLNIPLRKETYLERGNNSVHMVFQSVHNHFCNNLVNNRYRTSLTFKFWFRHLRNKTYQSDWPNQYRWGCAKYIWQSYPNSYPKHTIMPDRSSEATHLTRVISKTPCEIKHTSLSMEE